MARGQRKPIEEKIRDKQEVIAGLKVRIQSEERELEELKKEKQNKEVLRITSMLEEANISIDEAKEIIEQHILKTVAESA